MGSYCAKEVVQFFTSEEATKIWGLGKLNDKSGSTVLKEKIVKPGTFSDIQLVEQEIGKTIYEMDKFETATTLDKFLACLEIITKYNYQDENDKKNL